MVRAARVLLGRLLISTVAVPPPSSAQAAARPAGVPPSTDGAASIVASILLYGLRHVLGDRYVPFDAGT
ncbi:hypothetical protein GA0070216_11845 [Micromonospora matsumotoense]|uniref:Uncharacterized protein n=1 Tax=Micromonospora matsumotoense TaxID=121616 RepID=A0A1C5AJK2_9ACTN|nr:hypothetical protein [Micromonospora matsumotoense]SCF45387.1 hypothetical protein GA0070216_11845 [Micromonospora matsumotoense]